MSVRVKWTHRHFTDEIRFYFSPLTLKLSFYFISCNLFLKIFIVVPPLVIPGCSRSTDKDISSQGHASDPKCKENISSFLNTSTFIRLSHLYQEFCVQCIVIMDDAGMG